MIWAGSPGVMWRRAKSVRAITRMTGMVEMIGLRISGSTSADQPSGTTAVARCLHLDIPQDRGAELERTLHVLAERARSDKLPPGHVRHLVVGEELDLL